MHSNSLSPRFSPDADGCDRQSWFWGWYDYVGGSPQSSIPADFFPQASCKLGAPAGPYERVAGTSTYKRQFAHASVFVDLTNRTNSRVTFIGCDHDYNCMDY